MSNATLSAPAESSLYRRVWRWHFYAGLVCLPFLVLLATTGGLYLFKDSIESLLYARLFTVPAASAPGLDAQALLARAIAVQPGEAVRYVAPPSPGRSAEVGIRAADGVVAVYLHPGDGRVLGTLRDDMRLMEVVKRVHSLTIAGPVANHWVEVVAGWAIVLVVSGVFLWWPRGRSGGVYRVRADPAQRLWWRDVHAVTGITAAGAIVFLAVTGMPWSAFWGEQFGRLSSAWGVGVPKGVWGPAPHSSLPPMAGLQAVPWALSQMRLPQSQTPHSDHHGAPAAAPAPMTAEGVSLGLNQALLIFSQLGLPAGTPIRLPDDPRGVYTAMVLPDDVRDVRVVHLDRYSGEVLADIRYDDYGIAGRAVEWGISIHTGRQFGWINQLVMLAGCLAIVALAISGAVMWWKRRPHGRLAAPSHGSGDRAAAGAITVAALLGMIYPLLGASMLAALVADALVPADWRQRFGL
jgi:uncharacterized iron-regulated membrane protein